MLNNLLVEKYRPAILDDIILSTENRKVFAEFKITQQIPNILLLGKPGIGKTSLAKIIVNDILKCNYLYINASNENGIDVIRNKIITFSKTSSFDGGMKCVILDECDGATIDGQRALRNVMEEYHTNVRFVLTGNQKNRISAAIRSRCQEFDLTPCLDDCVKRCVEIIKKENIKVDDSSKGIFVKFLKILYPDLRKMINSIQRYTINGELKLPSYIINSEFAEKSYNIIFDKNETLTDVRSFFIENEQEFNSDYHDLLKILYEHIFNNGALSQEAKSKYLLLISEYMYRHSQVMDQEINAFSCVMKLRNG